GRDSSALDHVVSTRSADPRPFSADLGGLRLDEVTSASALRDRPSERARSHASSCASSRYPIFVTIFQSRTSISRRADAWPSTSWPHHAWPRTSGPPHASPPTSVSRAPPP